MSIAKKIPGADELRFVFFGSSKVSIYVLDELKKAGFIPASIVTAPDRPQGRGLVMTPNVVKTWATENKIKVFDPEKLDAKFAVTLKKENCDLFIVASYGKLMPESIVNMPQHKTLNVHPSLLPLYRGAAPLPTMMLDDAKQTGVTIMRMDAEMDHGPIIAKKEITVAEWPIYEEFEEMMAREGGRLLAEILPAWAKGELKEQEQDHSKATFTHKIKKEDALLDIELNTVKNSNTAGQSIADQYANFRKIQAYHEWPQAYFFVKKGGKQIRVKVTKASYTDGRLILEKVIPEGAGEMEYKDFLTGYHTDILKR